MVGRWKMEDTLSAWSKKRWDVVWRPIIATDFFEVQDAGTVVVAAKNGWRPNKQDILFILAFVGCSFRLEDLHKQRQRQRNSVDGLCWSSAWQGRRQECIWCKTLFKAVSFFSLSPEMSNSGYGGCPRWPEWWSRHRVPNSADCSVPVQLSIHGLWCGFIRFSLYLSFSLLTKLLGLFPWRCAYVESKVTDLPYFASKAPWKPWTIWDMLNLWSRI